MYDNNPTLENFSKEIDPTKQGQVFDDKRAVDPNGKKFYIESYGCAMNFSDSEIVASILADSGFSSTRIMEEADLILINTCSIREISTLALYAKKQNSTSDKDWRYSIN